MINNNQHKDIVALFNDPEYVMLTPELTYTNAINLSNLMMDEIKEPFVCWRADEECIDDDHTPVIEMDDANHPMDDMVDMNDSFAVDLQADVHT